MNRLQKLKKDCEGKKVLDIGCVGDRTSYGSDKWAHGHLNQVADSVKGIDIHEEGIEQIQEGGYDVELGDAEDFDLGEKYDVVLGAEVIEHLASPGSFLDSAREHLKDDGRLIITTPDVHSLLLLGAYFYPFYEEEEHVCGFTPELLSNLLERKGFEVEEMKKIPHEDIPSKANGLINDIIPSFLDFTIYCVASPVEEE